MSNDSNTEFDEIKQLLSADCPLAEAATGSDDAKRISIFSHHMVIAWLMFNFGAVASLLGLWIPAATVIETTSIVEIYILSVERGLLGRRDALRGKSVAKEAWLSLFFTLLFGVGVIMTDTILAGTLYGKRELTLSLIGVALLGACLSYLFYAGFVEGLLRTGPSEQDD